MQKSILIVLSLFITVNVFAQQEFGTHFMNGTWQANMTNPAMLPTNKVILSLPGLYGNLGISNITYNDIFDANGSADFNQAISQLEDDNYFRTNFAFQTFGVGVRTKKWFFSLNHEIRSNISLNYPKELAQLIWQGNAQFIGQNISFEPEFQFSNWHQIGLGIGFKINDMITVGTRIKKLSGIADISSRSDGYLNLETSDDIYQLYLDANYSVQTSGALDFNSFSDYSINFSNVDFNSFGQLFKGNPGVAFDLGVSLSLGKLSLSASALDMGSINWKDNVTQYSVEGAFDFEGITFTENILDGSEEFGSSIDSLEAIYHPSESHDSYRSAIPKQFYLSGNYALTQNLKVGALFYAENSNGIFRPAFTLAGNYNLASLIKIGAAYTVRKGSLDNLGLNAVVKLGPVQLIAATDNVFTVLNPKSHNHANGRIGLNLVFGQVDGTEDSDSPVDFY